MDTLVILAGGKSTRMGKDKIFLHVHERETFLEHLCQKAAVFFERVIISAGSEVHASGIRQLLPEAEICPDLYPDRGPMGGMVSVFEQTGAERFAVIPADVPEADMQILRFLLDQCGDDACVLKNRQGHPEPLIAAYGKETLKKMKELLAEDNCRIRAAFTEETRYISVPELLSMFPEKTEEELDKAFCNINTEEDYRNYIK